jgi:hypothetical protein
MLFAVRLLKEVKKVAVFVSYSHKDTEFVEKLAADLVMLRVYGDGSFNPNSARSARQEQPKPSA